MRAQRFDAMTRVFAGSISRRRSLTMLGGGTLAAVAAPSAVTASKASRRAKKKCRKQKGKCLNVVAERCTALTRCPPELSVEISECCNSLRTCAAADFMHCLFDVFELPTRPV